MLLVWVKLVAHQCHLQIRAAGVEIQLYLVATERDRAEIRRVILVTGDSRVAAIAVDRSGDRLGISGTDGRRIAEALRDRLSKLLQGLDLEGGSVL